MATVTDEELLDRLPDLVITHDTKEFYRGILDRELRLNRCADCGTWHQPPKPLCPECWSTDVRATAVSGRGTIHLLIWLRQGPPADGVDYSTPHPVATVELEEQPGLRFTSTVLDASMDDLAIGDAVELAWIERSGSPFPVFRKVAPARADR
jgi:uncharacterized OB-fold protein